MVENFHIKERMEVFRFDGQHVGIVDAIEGERIKLTKSSSEDHLHHYLQLRSVERVVDNRVYLQAGTEIPMGV